jgi:chemosensory pili system protein ChpA (sensor histidine kinase/response regulator)
MLSEQQQRIMGYFIEEAKDHLNTIEQGLVSLQATITDSDMVHEVFRAAHSVKGGAAMLGLDSIQHTAHRLEDYFKVLKECPQIQVDQKLETLFLQVYDTLHELVTQLQEPFGLSPDKAQEAMTQVEPVFAELSQHLSFLVNQAGGTPPDDVDLAVPVAAEPAQSVNQLVAAKEENALRFVFQTEVPARLREMLQLFKRPDTVDNRDQLQNLCRVLGQYGDQFQLLNWSTLLEVAQRAIGNPDNNYRTLAPLLIKDLKRSQEMILSGRVAEVAACDELLDLLPLQFSLEESEEESVDDEIAIEADLADLLSTVSSETDSIDDSTAWGDLELELPELDSSELDELDLDIPVTPNSDALDDWLFEENLFEGIHPVEPQNDQQNDQLACSTQAQKHLLSDDAAIAESDSESLTTEIGERSGPEVGTAELDSLADLFETDVPNLDSTWSDEEVPQFFVEASPELSAVEIREFQDLLNQDQTDSAAELTLDEEEEEDLSGLLNAVALQTNHHSTTPLSTPTSSDLASSQLQLALEEIANDLPSALELLDSTSDDIAVFFVQPDTEIGSDPSEDRDCAEASSTQDLDDGFSDLNSSSLTLDESLDETLDEVDATDSVTELLKPIDDSTSLLSFEFGAIESWEDDRSEDTNNSELENLFELAQESKSSDFLCVESLKDQGERAIAPLEDHLNLEAESLPQENESSLLDLDLSMFSLNLGETANENELDVNEILDEFLPNLVDYSDQLSLIENNFNLENYLSSEAHDSLAETLFENYDNHENQPLNSSNTVEETIEFSQLLCEDELNTSNLNSKLELNLNLSSNSDLTLIAAIDTINSEEVETINHQTTEQTTGELDSSDLLSFNGIELDEAELFEDAAIDGENPLLAHSSLEYLEFDRADLQDSNVSSIETATEEIYSSFADSDKRKSEQANISASKQDFETISTNSEVDSLAEEETSVASIVPIALDASEDFSELECILEAESFAEIGSSSSSSTVEEDVFSELEAMLENEPEPAQNSALTADDFADLEALLEGETSPSARLNSSFSLIATTGSATSITDDREFGDLEALLQEADQKLSVGSSPTRNPSHPTAHRPPRRRVTGDQTMRVSVKHLDNLNNLVGEMVVNRNSLEQAQERLRQFLDNLLYQVQQLNDVGQRMRDLYERSLLESSLLSSRQNYSLSQHYGAPATSPNHVTGISFDALEMDRFTGFHTLSQEMIELIVRVRESASDIDFVVEESDQITRNFRQITTQLQEGLTRSRMVPFAQTADRLPRGVRDNAIKYGKQAELTIEGRDTLIDKMIVEQLYDPMTHLVNNAIAHGIETPAERIAAGKSAIGQITIRAFHQGNQTVISVSDDGAGINIDAVKAKAVAKGLISSVEAQQLSRLEIYDLLFHHGFSTADNVDDLRGRGVGLDVVRNNLSEIRGSISIDSAIGKGTTFTIRLPLTLSISKALCCISNRARIAFAMDGVEDMLDVPKDGVHIDEQGRSCIQWRDSLLPFQPLSDLLKYNRVLGRGSVYGGNQEDDILSIVVLRSSSNYLALQVDQVLGEQEIVIKQLEGPVPKPIGVAGATVLGDGRIMPIADVLELIDLSQGRIRREASPVLWETNGDLGAPDAATVKTDPTVLIVDDSITVRELLSMTFNKVGYRVEQARDGQEAWEKLRSGLPCDLVFCDIEMPRMDGLELLSRLQKDPNLCDIPIAMLTSRGADRHRQMAVQLGAKGYFTKPYLEEVLLDAAQRMLKGEILVSG